MLLPQDHASPVNQKKIFFFGSESMLLQSYPGQIDPGGPFTTDRSEVEDEI